jgi:hypothetical protein
MLSDEATVVIAHEVLHSILGPTINPGSDDPYHDAEGIMRPASSNRKLGCLTVEALMKRGVYKSEIDPEYILDD